MIKQNKVVKRIPQKNQVRLFVITLVWTAVSIIQAHAISPVEPCQPSMLFYKNSSSPAPDVRRNGHWAEQVHRYQNRYGGKGYFFVVGESPEARMPNRQLAIRRAIDARAMLLKLGISNENIFIFADLPDENILLEQWTYVLGASITFCLPKSACDCPIVYHQRLRSVGNAHPILGR